MERRCGFDPPVTMLNWSYFNNYSAHVDLTSGSTTMGTVDA